MLDHGLEPNLAPLAEVLDRRDHDVRVPIDDPDVINWFDGRGSDACRGIEHKLSDVRVGIIHSREQRGHRRLPFAL